MDDGTRGTPLVNIQKTPKINLSEWYIWESLKLGPQRCIAWGRQRVGGHPPRARDGTHASKRGGPAEWAAVGGTWSHIGMGRVSQEYRAQEYMGVPWIWAQFFFAVFWIVFFYRSNDSFFRCVIQTFRDFCSGIFYTRQYKNWGSLANPGVRGIPKQHGMILGGKKARKMGVPPKRASGGFLWMGKYANLKWRITRVALWLGILRHRLVKQKWIHHPYVFFCKMVGIFTITAYGWFMTFLNTMFFPNMSHFRYQFTITVSPRFRGRMENPHKLNFVVLAANITNNAQVLPCYTSRMHSNWVIDKKRIQTTKNDKGTQPDRGLDMTDWSSLKYRIQQHIRMVLQNRKTRYRIWQREVYGQWLNQQQSNTRFTCGRLKLPWWAGKTRGWSLVFCIILASSNKLQLQKEISANRWVHPLIKHSLIETFPHFFLDDSPMQKYPIIFDDSGSKTWLLWGMVFLWHCFTQQEWIPNPKVGGFPFRHFGVPL